MSSSWPQEDVATLYRLLGEGKPFTEIADALHKPYRDVFGYVWRRSGPRRRGKARSGNGHMRRCHDCGAPTTDYRCPACWAKLRRKGGYNLSDTVQDVETCRSTLYQDGRI